MSAQDHKTCTIKRFEIEIEKVNGYCPYAYKEAVKQKWPALTMEISFLKSGPWISLLLIPNLAIFTIKQDSGGSRPIIGRYWL